MLKVHADELAKLPISSWQEFVVMIGVAYFFFSWVDHVYQQEGHITKSTWQRAKTVMIPLFIVLMVWRSGYIN